MYVRKARLLPITMKYDIVMASLACGRSGGYLSSFATCSCFSVPCRIDQSVLSDIIMRPRRGGGFSPSLPPARARPQATPPLFTQPSFFLYDSTLPGIASTVVTELVECADSGSLLTFFYRVLGSTLLIIVELHRASLCSR